MKYFKLNKFGKVIKQIDVIEARDLISNEKLVVGNIKNYWRKEKEFIYNDKKSYQLFNLYYVASRSIIYTRLNN